MLRQIDARAISNVGGVIDRSPSYAAEHRDPADRREMTPAGGERLARDFLRILRRGRRGRARGDGPVDLRARSDPRRVCRILPRADLPVRARARGRPRVRRSCSARAVARPREAGAERGAGLAFAASPFLIRGLCVSVVARVPRDGARKARARLGDAGLLRVVGLRRSGFCTPSSHSRRSARSLFSRRACGSWRRGGSRSSWSARSRRTRRNGDPATDSLEAAHLLFILVCILWIGVVRTRPEIGGADDVEFRHSTREAR